MVPFRIHVDWAGEGALVALTTAQLLRSSSLTAFWVEKEKIFTGILTKLRPPTWGTLIGFTNVGLSPQ